MNLYGEGDYALSAVKVVDGTDGYVKLAEERGLCQDQESYQDCIYWERQTNSVYTLGRKDRQTTYL